MSNHIAFAAVALGTAILLAGCGRPANDDHAHRPGQPTAAAVHDHAEEGPHGGELIELDGGAYHAELLHDEPTHTVTVHLLDAAGKEEVAIEAPEIGLKVFQDGEFIHRSLKPAADGPSSEFTLVDETVCDLLLHGEEVHGRLSVDIDGQTLVGLIAHHAREHAGHDHAGHDHADQDDADENGERRNADHDHADEHGEHDHDHGGHGHDDE